MIGFDYLFKMTAVSKMAEYPILSDYLSQQVFLPLNSAHGPYVFTNILHPRRHFASPTLPFHFFSIYSSSTCRPLYIWAVMARWSY